MERALYNTVLAGVSQEGDHFFYANPLTSYPNVSPYEHFSGITSAKHYRRDEWFFCPCCPSNLARIVASIGGYFYSTAADRLYVHLYNNSNADFEFGGSNIQIEQQTNYPWDGHITCKVQAVQPVSFDMALRVPAWCKSHNITVNGQPCAAHMENGYVIIAREWHSGDTVNLDLEMTIERIASHPSIRQNAGQIALQHGPLIYCLEEVDNGPELANMVIPSGAQMQMEFDNKLLGGTVVISGDAERVEPSTWPGELYQPKSQLQYKYTTFRFKAIPYFLWANREPGEMRVWIREV
jgi:uncharacterized protein